MKHERQGSILPSGPAPPEVTWSPDHLRLHRHLLRRPTLLPRGAPLLLAVSGGQDSMAMARLLLDLRRLHGWTLTLWHGNHGWRPESSAQAEALRAWAQQRQLTIEVDRAPVPRVGEAAARQWRYSCLEQTARRLGCRHVVTAHTASDRAETVLLHLARGSHRRGLASLRARRDFGSDQGVARGAHPEVGAGIAGPQGGTAISAPPIATMEGSTAESGPLWLIRPLLIFSRADTARICSALGCPVWIDPSNEDLGYARNRLRAKVLPVLESLHPGASHRISALAERLAEEQDQREELLELALTTVMEGRGDERDPMALRRRALARLSRANQRGLLQHWLHRQIGRNLEAEALNQLLGRLMDASGSGCQDLAGGWRLCWNSTRLELLRRGSAAICGIHSRLDATHTQESYGG